MRTKELVERETSPETLGYLRKATREGHLGLRLPEYITFTGCDDPRYIPKMNRIQDQFPGLVEWGILLSSKRAGDARYPDMHTRSKIYQGIRPQSNGSSTVALHLCGAFAGMANQESTRPEDDLDNRMFFILRRELEGWVPRAIQVNHREPNPAALKGLAARLGKRRIALVIGQTRDEVAFPEAINPMDEIIDVSALKTMDPRRGPCVSWLFDRSGGRGVVAERLPVHNRLLELAGFAGGIGPDNVMDVIRQINAASSPVLGPYWIDMESGVRTDDRFDLGKVESVLEQVYGR